MIDCLACSAYNQMQKEYPRLWFEVKWKKWLTMAIAIPVLAWWQTSIGIPSRSITMSLLGLSLYLFVWISDVWTTKQVMGYKPEYDRRGLEFWATEENPLLPDVPSLKELTTGWSARLALAGAVLVYFIPILGLLSFIDEGSQALSNWRNTQKLQRELYLFDQSRHHKLKKKREEREVS